MIREITDSSPREDIITLYCSLYEDPLSLHVGVEDTVDELKVYLGERMELFFDEMTICTSTSCPLSGDMRLDTLQREHRPLLLLVHEGGEETERREDSCWWSQEVPERYLGYIEEGRSVFDFRYLAEESVKRVRSWLYQEREAEEIWLLGTHPQIMEILYAVAEDVRSLIRLRRIVIESPDRVGYSIPPRSNGRAKAFRHLGGQCRLRREGLVYLYQHLLLDQYRDREVEICLDGGLLPGMDKRGPFLP